MSSVDDLVEHGIELLRAHEPADGYIGRFSGGKDSVVIKELARMAGVGVRWNYSMTYIDPPELVSFIRHAHADVHIVRPPPGPFFKYARRRGLPFRQRRWCCEQYKECGTPSGARMIVGIRAEESARRASIWSEFTTLKVKKHVEAVLPIFEWASDELWDFIRDARIPYCSLYDEGFHRLGCIGCPLPGQAERDRCFARWPRFEKKWEAVARAWWDRWHGHITRHGNAWYMDRFFTSADQMWEWWRHSAGRLPRMIEEHRPSHARSHIPTTA